MVNGRRQVTVTRCSLVVIPVDIWSRRAIGGAVIRVALEPVLKPPVRKADGSYLFLNVSVQNCTLTISSAVYMPVRMDVDLSELDPLMPVIAVPMLPAKGYPYPPAATGIVTRIIDAGGKGAPHAEVLAYAADDTAYRARVAQDGLQPGERKIRIGSLMGKAIAGESFMLRDKGQEELIRLAAVAPGGDVLLERRIVGSYRRGALLLPAALTRSAEDGSVIVPFRGTLPPAFGVQMKARCGEAAVTVSWTARAGEVLVLPEVTVQNER